MTPSEGNVLRLGLYRVWWMSGGSSLASVGMNSDGSRWLAPTNWVASTSVPDWGQVLKMERLAAELPGGAGATPWMDHVRTARDLLDTILEVEDG